MRYLGVEGPDVPLPRLPRRLFERAAEHGRSRPSSCVPPQAVGDEVCLCVPRWVESFDGRDQCSKIGTGCSPPDSWLEGISAVATYVASQATRWRSDSEETVG